MRRISQTLTLAPFSILNSQITVLPAGTILLISNGKYFVQLDTRVAL